MKQQYIWLWFLLTSLTLFYCVLVLLCNVCYTSCIVLCKLSEYLVQYPFKLTPCDILYPREKAEIVRLCGWHSLPLYLVFTFLTYITLWSLLLFNKASLGNEKKKRGSAAQIQSAAAATSWEWLDRAGIEVCFVPGWTEVLCWLWSASCTVDPTPHLLQPWPGTAPGVTPPHPALLGTWPAGMAVSDCSNTGQEVAEHERDVQSNIVRSDQSLRETTQREVLQASERDTQEEVTEQPQVQCNTVQSHRRLRGTMWHVRKWWDSQRYKITQ